MAVTNEQINAALNAFAASISKQPLGLAHHCPPDDATSDDCLANATGFAETYGGSIRFGWYFRLQTADGPGPYLIAQHHVVWHNPEDGHLVDVTPYVEVAGGEVIKPNNDLLFLVDDSAEPYVNGELAVPLPRRFRAITDDADLQAHVAQLQQAEYAAFNANYGASF
jgi:hypothetical protein